MDDKFFTGVWTTIIFYFSAGFSCLRVWFRGLRQISKKL